MDRLWAPWRITYVSQKQRTGCIFCQAIQGRLGKEIIFKTEHSFLIPNLYPYNNGHVMVSPRRHVKELSLLRKEELADLFESLITAQDILKQVLKPEGFNIGMNISRAAGAGIVGHLHIHIVPRWKGDTNFMPITAGTKVISQSIEELSKKLKHAYAKTYQRARR